MFINNIFIEALHRVCRDNYRLQVIHITGNKDYQRVVNSYKIMGLGALVYRFYEDIALLYKASDLIISRSGASTIAELCFLGKPAVLIPYPHAYGHQKKNALYFSKRGAGICRDQDSLSKDSLCRILKGALDDFSGFSLMAVCASKQKIWRHKEDFAKIILEHI